MKVMDPERYAAMCAERILGERTVEHFGGTTALEAELDDDQVTEHQMKEALERFGCALVKQFDKTSSGSKIIGVELHSINFSFILVPKG